jgi:hypothetical protein
VSRSPCWCGVRDRPASAEISSGHASDRTVEHERRADPTGAHVATAGVVVLLIATLLDRVSTEDGTSASGYEADTVIPVVAHLGLGLAVAPLYAIGRTRGRQHRGQTLTRWRWASPRCSCRSAVTAQVHLSRCQRRRAVVR